MWSDIVAVAAELEAQQQAEEAREANARKLAELDAIDAARSELRGLLGPLAEEMEIGYEGMNYGVQVFRLRPRHWRPDIDRGFYARYRVGDVGGWRKGWVLGTAYTAGNSSDIALDRPIAADSVEQNVVWWLAARQGEYDQVVMRRLAALVGTLVDDPKLTRTTPDEARAAYDEMTALVASRVAEWTVLYGQWCEAYEAKVAGEAAEAEETVAALERFADALMAWRDERDAVNALNQAVIDALIREIDIPIMVCDLEYAVVARDRDGELHLKTETEQVTATLATPSQATVLKDGRLTRWSFANPVRLSDPYAVRPSEATASGMFALARTPYGTVAFTEFHREKVERVVNGLRRVPEQPDWNEIGGGRPWTMGVRAIFDEVLGDE